MPVTVTVMEFALYLSRMNPISQTELPNELYSGLSAELVGEFRQLEEFRMVPSGMKLVQLGRLPEHLVIVCSGRVEIRVFSSGQTIPLGTRGAGKVFGLRALISGETPETEVICIEDCRVILIPKKEFLRILQVYPQIYFAVARIMSSDLALAHGFLKNSSRRSLKPGAVPSMNS